MTHLTLWLSSTSVLSKKWYLLLMQLHSSGSTGHPSVAVNCGIAADLAAVLPHEQWAEGIWGICGNCPGKPRWKTTSWKYYYNTGTSNTVLQCILCLQWNHLPPVWKSSELISPVWAELVTALTGWGFTTRERYLLWKHKCVTGVFVLWCIWIFLYVQGTVKMSTK